MFKIIVICSLVLLSYLVGGDCAENPNQAAARIHAHDQAVVEAVEAAGANYSRYYTASNGEEVMAVITLSELDEYYRYR